MLYIILFELLMFRSYRVLPLQLNSLRNFSRTAQTNYEGNFWCKQNYTVYFSETKFNLLLNAEIR